ncbi:hypothetical protein, conserved [Leishmania tarentolae]|uniref:Uncharacterized protein n=1 Tax=Leishmania tarentolae TaxID=5689 RepID=A0A640KQR8_LEITA|nr:hypothetical protein, conserved [Leishmania tarentolae]
MPSVSRLAVSGARTGEPLFFSAVSGYCLRGTVRGGRKHKVDTRFRENESTPGKRRITWKSVSLLPVTGLRLPLNTSHALCCCLSERDYMRGAFRGEVQCLFSAVGSSLLHCRRLNFIISSPYAHATIMLENLDEWDSYRLFCISATAADGDAGELQDRLGIVEEYLTDYEALCRALHKSKRTTHAQEIHRLLADEAEERRFLNEDSAMLPWTLFIKLSFSYAQELVVENETTMRHSIVALYTASLPALLFSFENVQRMQLTWEALDSVALKACIVGRFGVREGQLARTSIPGYTAGSTFPPSARSRAAAAALRSLLAEEHQDRQEIIEARRQYVAASLLVLASNEKLRGFDSASRGSMTFLPQRRGKSASTARQALDDSATRIQSAYRGYHVRVVCARP